MEDNQTNGAEWLDDIGIASPCTANWDEMKGDDRCRFCSQCSLHVFDLSSMTREDAEELVASKTGDENRGRLCVRFTRRADGTVLTRDCPVGLRQRLRRSASRLVAMCTAAFAFLGCRAEPARTGGGNEKPPEQVEPQPLQGDILLMGEVEAPPPKRLMGRVHRPVVAPPDGKGEKR